MSRKKERTPVLTGKKALIVGIANDNSIAYGCAKAFNELGADLAITYLNEKAKPHVEPLVAGLNTQIFAPLDVSRPGELEDLFQRIRKEWGLSLIHISEPTRPY